MYRDVLSRITRLFSRIMKSVDLIKFSSRITRVLIWLNFNLVLRDLCLVIREFFTRITRVLIWLNFYLVLREFRFDYTRLMSRNTRVFLLCWIFPNILPITRFFDFIVHKNITGCNHMIQTHHRYKPTNWGPKFMYLLFKNHSSNRIARKKMIIKLYVYFLLETTYTKPEQIRERGGGVLSINYF